MSESWQRAQPEYDSDSRLGNEVERIVWLDEGNPHRVVFALTGDTLRATGWVPHLRPRRCYTRIIL